MAQVIEKIGQSLFTAKWTEKPDVLLKMDFKPLMQRMGLKGKFCLLHWQAKPFGLRRWGVYQSLDDLYYPVDADKLCIKTISFPIQIDETTVEFPPTAVLWFRNSVIEQKGSFTYILPAE